MHRRVILTGCVLIGAAVSLLLILRPSRHTDLFQIARPVVSISDWEGGIGRNGGYEPYVWVNSDSVVYIEATRFSKDASLIRLDTTNGKKTRLPLKIPDTGWTYGLHHFTLTPDRKRFIIPWVNFRHLPAYPRGDVETTADLDGTGRQDRAQRLRFAPLFETAEGTRLEIDEQGLRQTQISYELRPGGVAVAFSNAGKSLPSSTRKSVPVRETTKTGTRLLALMPPGNPVRCDIAVSPDGAQIAWLVQEDIPLWERTMMRIAATLGPKVMTFDPTPPKYDLYVSPLFGTPRYLGTFAPRPKGYTQFPVRPSALRWSPDKHKLGFIYERQFWTLDISSL